MGSYIVITFKSKTVCNTDSNTRTHGLKHLKQHTMLCIFPCFTIPVTSPGAVTTQCITWYNQSVTGCGSQRKHVVVTQRILM